MKTLIDLYNIPSCSNSEQKMTEHVAALFGKIGCRVKKKNGNLYITKGKANEYPCIAAHIDEVHDGRGSYEAIYSEELDIIFGWSYSHNNFCGIGADDKNGIWVAYQAAKALPAVKISLFRGEEIGCVGSSLADMKFFNDCRFVLQVDRKNASDLITSISERMVSDEFMADIKPLMDKYGYKETYGLMTDVQALTQKGVGICCVNMSCGYYNPHTSTEYTKWSELQNTLRFVVDICYTLTKVYRHTPATDMWKDYSLGFSGDWNNYEIQMLTEDIIYGLRSGEIISLQDAWNILSGYYNVPYKTFKQCFINACRQPIDY